MLGDDTNRRVTSPPLGGSISPETIRHICEKTHADPPSIDQIRRSLYNGSHGDMQSFFSRFGILKQIKWSTETIKMAIDDVIAHAAAEGIEHLELRFTIDKYIPFLGGAEDTIDFILRCMRRSAIDHQLRVIPIFCLKHEYSKVQKRQLFFAAVQLIDDIAALDFVGDETQIDFDICGELYKAWRQRDGRIIAHIGEFGGPDNIKRILEFEPDRIAHGITIVHDTDLMRLCANRRIPFEVCISSNLATGVVQRLVDHPIKKMVKNGINVTIGTDDPVILKTSLVKEYNLCRNVGLNELEIDAIMRSTSTARWLKISKDVSV